MFSPSNHVKSINSSVATYKKIETFRLLKMSFAPQKKEGGWGGGATHHTESWMKNRNLLWQKRLIGSCWGRRWVAIWWAVWQPFSLWRRRPMIRGPPDHPHNESPDAASSSICCSLITVWKSRESTQLNSASASWTRPQCHRNTLGPWFWHNIKK